MWDFKPQLNKLIGKKCTVMLTNPNLSLVISGTLQQHADSVNCECLLIENGSSSTIQFKSTEIALISYFRLTGVGVDTPDAVILLSWKE